MNWTCKWKLLIIRLIGILKGKLFWWRILLILLNLHFNKQKIFIINFIYILNVNLPKFKLIYLFKLTNSKLKIIMK